MNPNTVALMFALPLLLLPVLYVLDAVQRDRAVESWLSVSAINGAVGSSADVLDPFGLNAVAVSLMSDLDGAPAGSAPSSAPMLDADDYDADNGFDPFDARELPNVADRIATPFCIREVARWADYSGDIITVHGVNRPTYYSLGVDVLDANRDIIRSIEASTQVELVGPVTVLDAPADVTAYVADGELLCADHGAPFDIGVENGSVSPVFRGRDLDAVEWCSAGFDHGHSFCGSCGTDIEPTGHPDSGFAGPLFHCWNCSTNAVSVEDSQVSSSGWEYVHGFDDLLNDYTVTVSDVPGYEYPFGWSSRLNPKPSGTVDAIRDASPWNRFGMNTSFFVAWVDDDPSAGVLLVLDTTGNGAWGEAVDHFEDKVDWSGVADTPESADEYRLDFEASVQCVRVARDAVVITTKEQSR